MTCSTAASTSGCADFDAAGADCVADVEATASVEEGFVARLWAVVYILHHGVAVSVDCFDIVVVEGWAAVVGDLDGYCA